MQTSSVKSSEKRSTANKKDWHRKIAKSRGKKWIQNVVLGRRDAQINPSVLRQIRLRKGLFQDKFAVSIKVSESVYGAIERGKQYVKRDRARLIASRLGVNVADVFNQVSSKGPKANHKFVAKIAKYTIK